MKKVDFLTVLLVFTLLGIAGIGLGGCSQGPRYRTMDGSVWHTSYHIVYGVENGTVPDLSDSVLVTLRHVEMSLSPFNNQSLISAINRNESDNADTLIECVFELSAYLNRLSNGAFDPTVGPLADAWGFGTNGRTVTPLSQSQIDSILEYVGFSQCWVDYKTKTVIKKHPSTRFNFSAVTKGLACDCVIEMLERNGVNNCLVEIGGDIAVRGVNHEGKLWTIQVDMPEMSDSIVIHKPLTAISVADGGIATSGNYRNYRLLDSVTVGHTIDPRTGYPVETDVISATVVAPSAATADAVATTLMAVGSEAGLKLVEHLTDVGVLIVVKDSVTGAPGLIGNAFFPALNIDPKIPFIRDERLKRSK